MQVRESVRSVKSSPGSIRVSVVTVCLNSRDLIERTLRSVIDQSYPLIEYIVIDGGSTDGTLDILGRYSEHIDVLVSERDDGIYDAMNKGLERAKGSIICFLNSGDYFYDANVVESVVKAFEENPGCEIVEGDIVFYDGKEEEYRAIQKESPIGLARRGIHHQAVFARMSLFREYGLFDTGFRIYGDLDWFLRCILGKGARVVHIGIPISYYLRGGLSETQRERRFLEKTTVYDRHLTFRTILRHGGEEPLETLVILAMRIYYRLRLLCSGGSF